MHVCHFVAQAGLGRGDAFVPLVNALAGQVQVSLVVPADARFLDSLDPRVRVRTYRPGGSRWNPRLYLELWRVFRALKPDLVHTHFAKAAEIFSRLNRLLRLPFVATKHNPRKGRVFNRVRPVIAVSQGVKQSVRHDDVTVIYNGILPEPVKPDPPQHGFRIIAVGRLTAIKGFDRLLQQLSQLDFDYRMTFVGDGEERESLQARAEALGIGERVEFAGFRTDIPQLLAASHLQVMSSHSEGFSLAMIEALFHAPVFISTPVAGCTEMLSEPFLVAADQLADRIADVHARYDDYREQFDQLRAQRTPLLHVDRCAEQHLALYGTQISRSLG